VLTAAQVASQLGLSKRKVYDLARTGELVSYRFGDAVRFDPDDVERYKAACRSNGTSATSAGGGSSAAVWRASATGIVDYFRRAGVEPKLTPSTVPKPLASPQLRLASTKPTR
jgi:excisionase family DNA binding protein